MTGIILMCVGSVILIANPFFYFWGLEQIMDSCGRFWVPALVLMVWIGSLLGSIALIIKGYAMLEKNHAHPNEREVE